MTFFFKEPYWLSNRNAAAIITTYLLKLHAKRR